MFRNPFWSAPRAGVRILLLVATLLTLGLRPSEQAVSAEADANPLPSELQYLPADAALFVHADAAKLWNGSLGKSLRAADAKMFDELATNTKKMFGATPDMLKTATFFMPKFKAP